MVGASVWSGDMASMAGVSSVGMISNMVLLFLCYVCLLSVNLSYQTDINRNRAAGIGNPKNLQSRENFWRRSFRRFFKADKTIPQFKNN
jgi:hypothetical protein